MGVIGEALLKEIEDADKDEDESRLMSLLDYAMTRAREQFYFRGGKITRNENHSENLPMVA